MLLIGKILVSSRMKLRRQTYYKLNDIKSFIRISGKNRH
jgi:hypothetical protein